MYYVILQGEELHDMHSFFSLFLLNIMLRDSSIFWSVVIDFFPSCYYYTVFHCVDIPQFIHFTVVEHDSGEVYGLSYI